MAINGGHLVARYLKEVEGVETVFALSGGHIEAILDGFTEYRIRTIDVRHEQVAAMAAHAWSVYAGQTGVCLVTAGPGFTNALTGIANAYLDNAPLVVLCGKHPLKEDLRGALQEMNQIDMVKPITKWAATCYETKRIPEYLSMAFRYATMGRPGPVFLELPPDILNISIPEESAPLPKYPVRKYTVHPDDADLKRAADLINGAKQPLFLGGSGVGFSCCGTALGAVRREDGDALPPDELRTGGASGQPPAVHLGCRQHRDDGDPRAGRRDRHRGSATQLAAAVRGRDSARGQGRPDRHRPARNRPKPPGRRGARRGCQLGARTSSSPL